MEKRKEEIEVFSSSSTTQETGFRGGNRVGQMERDLPEAVG